jgi:hypothetical protein
MHITPVTAKFVNSHNRVKSLSTTVITFMFSIINKFTLFSYKVQVEEPIELSPLVSNTATDVDNAADSSGALLRQQQ